MKMIPYNKEKHGKYIEGVSPRCYVRGDIDHNGNMWTSFVPLSQIDHTEREALNAYTKKFVDMPCMESVASLYNFCLQYPEAAFGDPDDKTFLFFKKDEMIIHTTSTIKTVLSCWPFIFSIIKSNILVTSFFFSMEKRNLVVDKHSYFFYKTTLYYHKILL